ncbi:MAG: hypothetical protein EOO88_54780, partial [Pedobacter sp.]
MKIILITITLLTVNLSGFSQMSRFSNLGDSLYLLKQYVNAINAYQQGIDSCEKFQNPKSLYYNIACCYALLGQKKPAITNLQRAVVDFGYKNYDGLLKDDDLKPIHETPEWKQLINKLKKEKQALNDPHMAQLVTTDIHNFWTAYDLALSDTANRKAIFLREYFN